MHAFNENVISLRQHWCRLIIYPNFTKILEPKHWTDLWKTKHLRVTNEICACSLISHFFFNYQRWNTKTVISNLNLNIKMIFWNQQILKETSSHFIFGLYKSYFAWYTNSFYLFYIWSWWSPSAHPLPKTSFFLKLPSNFTLKPVFTWLHATKKKIWTPGGCSFCAQIATLGILPLTTSNRFKEGKNMYEIKHLKQFEAWHFPL